eukprot:6193882-Pleurochrysis_carterae.AAC.6
MSEVADRGQIGTHSAALECAQHRHVRRDLPDCSRDLAHLAAAAVRSATAVAKAGRPAVFRHCARRSVDHDHGREARLGDEVVEPRHQLRVDRKVLWPERVADHGGEGEVEDLVE